MPIQKRLTRLPRLRLHKACIRLRQIHEKKCSVWRTPPITATAWHPQADFGEALAVIGGVERLTNEFWLRDDQWAVTEPLLPLVGAAYSRNAIARFSAAFFCSEIQRALARPSEGVWATWNDL